MTDESGTPEHAGPAAGAFADLGVMAAASSTSGPWPVERHSSSPTMYRVILTDTRGLHGLMPAIRDGFVLIHAGDPAGRGSLSVTT